MQILLHRGKGIINSLVRWQTRSHYAHASVLLRDDENVIIQALPGKGVHVARLTDWEGIDKFSIESPFDETAVAHFLGRALGRKYDYLSVIRFLTRQKAPLHERRWFCSELVFAAFAAGGLRLLNVDEPYKVSPALLAMSPWLKKI